MSQNTPIEISGPTTPQAEFDFLADEYRVLHKKNIAITGESPEFFSEFKIADLAEYLNSLKLSTSNILDFGCGIGNSLPYLRKYFQGSEICCADVSSRSIEIAKSRFPGNEIYVRISKDIPLPANSVDVVFSACVFHHIPHREHIRWLAELCRITKPHGILAIYEHNPLNPLTMRAVRTCPLDTNARLIKGRIMQKRALLSGWEQGHVEYKMFFPAYFAALRTIERFLRWLPVGAQYRMLARKAG